MTLHKEFFFRSLRTVTFVTALGLASCTTKNTGDNVAVEPADTSEQTYVDTSTSSEVSTDSVNNSNLFDTATTSDTAPAGTTTSTNSTTTVNYAPYSTASQYCLNGMPYSTSTTGTTSTSSTSTTSTNSTGQPYWYGQGTAGLSTACVDPSQNLRITDDMMMNWGLQSFNSMQSCYEIVMARAPQYCSQGTDASTIFKMARMAMVRCFRGILRQQMNLVRWAPEQTQSYQTNDQSLYLLLQLFSQE